jgi:hypothetical protein
LCASEISPGRGGDLEEISLFKKILLKRSYIGIFMSNPVRASNAKTPGRIGPGKEYRNLLERDFLCLLRFDPSVQDFRSQPLKIEYEFGNRRRVFLPSVLIHYHAGAEQTQPLLAHVQEGSGPWDQGEFAVQFAAARRVCEVEDWRFSLVEERHIRIGRLQNANFFARFLRRTADEERAKRLMDALGETDGGCSVDTLLLRVCPDQDRGLWLPDLWTLIAQRRIATNLDSPVTNSTLLTLKDFG